MLSDDYADVDDYALLQAQFDNVDIPPGIEAPFTWLPEYDLGLKKTGNSTCNAKDNSKIEGSKMGSSSLQIKTDNVDQSSGTNLSQPAPNKKKSAASQCSGQRDSNHSSGSGLSKSRRFMKSFHSKMKSAFFGSKKHGSDVNADTIMVQRGGKTPYSRKFGIAKKATGSSSSSFHSNFIGQDGSLHPPVTINSYNTAIPTHAGLLTSHPSINPFSINNYNTANPTHYFDAPPEHVPRVLKSTRDGDDRATVNSPDLIITGETVNETLRKFRSFKHFDTVIDTSDHFFMNYNSSTKQNPKSWAKKIQEEWKILEKDLPDTIFVRVYESRMDLLRAVIIGAEGTPYHDGLFFFDIHFPSGYPNVPPLVHYHSRGLRLNPNLYACGKVCLSLLNTWSGGPNEKWTPGVSTILQVLVSIQGLILNAKPFFNEPGFANMSGSANGERKALQYNEDTFLLSLNTMMYTIRKPRKHFEDLVVGHFYSRAHDILVACKAYMEGAQVGCLVKGGVQDVDEGDKSCSNKFKSGLVGYVNPLVKEFERIGVKGCEKFISLPATTT
nr:probable ubiquitin-conjugating enzyme E2 26 isoform X2 [Cicer arietinum]